ncbi:tetratricopeptide repeat protein [Shewanella gelidii]|uniref:MSHA biogenesis protein MshN n=1 Tax=Shewanella gelidii TaxID=1642821 RepID=A0A917JXN0_9GAMM|nr:tetratricopeptide repeat protein [Shewanella gelidii]MCL1098751.1 tetratricopeptide repeat protein [Shewanella gelidii]GGI87877.1 MSHA biogenesis protein MshN [Shewanella gelidii]
MSVINQMLKDLDTRQQPHAVEQVPAVRVPPQTKKQGYSVLFAACAVSLTLGGAAVFGYQYWQSLKADIASPSATSYVEHTQKKAEKATEEHTIQPAMIDGNNAAIASREPTDTELVDKIQNKGSHASGAEQLAMAEVTPIQERVASFASEKEARQTQTQTQVPQPKSPQVAKVAAKVAQPVTKKVAVVKSPSVAPVNMAVKEVKLSAKELGQKSAQAAKRAESLGRLDEAIAAYNQTLVLNAADHQTRKQLAALYFGRNQLPQAATVLTQGLVLYPDNSELSLLLSRVHQASGDFKQAIAVLTDIPDFGDFARQKWLQQTDLAQKVGDNPLAEKAYRQLVRAEPNQGRWWMGLAHALDSQQKYTDAKAAYQFALTKSGLSAQAAEYIEARLVQLGDS